MKGTGEILGLQCPQAKRLFSPYLDGAVTGTEMLALQHTCRIARLATTSIRACGRRSSCF